MNKVKILKELKRLHKASVNANLNTSPTWDGHPLSIKMLHSHITECELFEYWLKHQQGWTDDIYLKIKRIPFIYYAVEKLDFENEVLNTQWIYGLTKKFPFLSRWFDGYGYALCRFFDDGSAEINIAVGDPYLSLIDILFFMAHEMFHAYQYAANIQSFVLREEWEADKWANKAVQRYFDEIYTR